MIADIDATTTLPDVTDLLRRLSDAERAVLVAHESEMLEQYQDGWTGWKYKDRPAGAPRNVSQQAWRTKVDSTDRGAALVVTNAARDWRHNRRAYTGYVRRSGGAPLEWEVQRDQTLTTIVPRLVAALLAAVMDAHNKPGPTRKIRSGTGIAATADLEF